MRLLVKKGKSPAQTITRARILLLSYSGKTDEEIRKTLDVSVWTPQNVRKRYVKEGIQRALYDAPRSGQPKTTTAREEAEIIAIACTEPDIGSCKWTLNLLTQKVKSEFKDRKKPVSRGTIYNILLQNELKPWREKNVVHIRNNR